MSDTEMDARMKIAIWMGTAYEAEQRAAFWRRSALGTWAVNVALSVVLAYLLLFR